MSSLTLKPAEAVGMTRAEKKAVKKDALAGLLAVDRRLGEVLDRVKVPLSGREMERELERSDAPDRHGRKGG
jgi:hypothetical protein